MIKVGMACYKIKAERTDWPARHSEAPGAV